MTDAAAWIAERRPCPPGELAARIDETVARAGATQRPLDEALTELGRAEVDAALQRPGRVRESAFRLLVGDALVTYACEAALEGGGPEAALESVLERAVGP